MEEDQERGPHDSEADASQASPEAAPYHTQGGPESLPDAKGLLATCISLFAAKAWEAMGLTPNPATKQNSRQLDDAQIAIDAASALADLLRPHTSDTERREIEVLLTNLRLNFVEQKSKRP
jgi:hypothetical protein